jgi:hypothetical protein
MPRLEGACRSPGRALMVFPAMAGLLPGDLQGPDLLGVIARIGRLGWVFLQAVWASAPMPQGQIGKDHNRIDNQNEKRFSLSKNVSNEKGSGNAHP